MSGTTAKLSEEERVTVPPEAEMDDDTFILHMNYRHQDSLGGLDELWYASEEVTEAWRAFHWRLHQIHPRITLAHDHREAA